MLPSLRFAARGVARRDFGTPSLLHFRLADGRVTGTNGTLTMSAPLAGSLTTAPLAVPFLKALDACGETIAISHIGDTLLVKSGTFQDRIPCIAASEVPNIQPEGKYIRVLNIKAAFKALRPFVSTDTSRPWACGVRLAGNSIYATNNVVIAEYWIMTGLSTANVPVDVIDEVLRVKEEPTAIQINDSHIAFLYEDGRWIKCALCCGDAPDLGELFKARWGGEMVKITTELKKAVETLLPYDGVICFKGDKACVETATVEVACPVGVYVTRYLADVMRAATVASWQEWGAAWAGEGIRGVMAGIRQ